MKLSISYNYNKFAAVIPAHALRNAPCIRTVILHYWVLSNGSDLPFLGIVQLQWKVPELNSCTADTLRQLGFQTIKNLQIIPITVCTETGF